MQATTRKAERISVTREDGGKENCLRNRLEKRHFRALRDREGQELAHCSSESVFDSKLGLNFAFVDGLFLVRV